MTLALKDEMVLNMDAIIPSDPALGIREKAQAFMASREWSTPSVFYGDQPEPEFSTVRPQWSIALCLGLDHVPTTEGDWFADVKAMMEHAHGIIRETGGECNVEFRLSSKLWYSETIQILGDEPDQIVDYQAVKGMLEQFINQPRKRGWWQKLFGR